MSFITRREFVKLSAATVALLTSASSVTAAEKEIKPEALKKKLLGDKKFRPLKLNRKQAEERYQQLLARVPEKYRPTVKLPEGAVNRKAEVLKAWEKFQDYPAYQLRNLKSDDPEYLEKQDQYYEEYSLEDNANRPFADDAVFARIQDWITAQKPCYEQLVALSKERNYCSEYDRADWQFYPLEDFQVSDLISVHRQFAYFIQQMCFAAARGKEWNKIVELIKTSERYFHFISHGKKLIVDHTVNCALLDIFAATIVRMLGYPELPNPIAQKLYGMLQQLETKIPDPRPTMVMEIFQFSLSQLAVIPVCKNSVNQALAMFGYGLVGNGELDLQENNKQGNTEQQPNLMDIYLNYYMFALLTSYELGKLLDKHAQPYDTEATFVLWLKEQTSWFDFYDKHRHDMPFPKYESPHPTATWMQEIPHFESIGEKQSELKKLDHLANLNGFERIEWSENLDKVTNPLGTLYVAPINIQTAKDNPRTHSLSSSYEFQVTSRKTGQLRMYVLAATCLLHERQQQRMPEKLSDLVQAKLIPALPIDPSSGKDFYYDPAKRLLWDTNALDPKTGELPDLDESELSYTPGIIVIPKLLAELSK
jgi:hypothetical protein